MLLQRSTISMSVEVMSSLYLFLFVVPIVLLSITTFVGVEAKRNVAALEVDTSHAEYVSIEKALWKYITKPRITREAQLKKVYDTHRSFARDNLQRLFDESRYEIVQHSEWIMLKSDLMYVNSIFEAFRVFLNTNPIDGEYNEQAALDLCDNVLRNDSTFSMEKIFKQIELIMVKQATYYRALLDANNHLSGTRQSCQQFLYSLYADIALTELKGYTMMQFSWMILRIYGKGNFTQESDLMREDYAKRTERTLLKLREVMRRADRIVWQNDPIKHVKGKTYDEVTRLLQGYIENEVDLNPEETCRENCQFYEATKSYGCFKNLYCAKQQRCSGRLLNCGYVDSDMWICPSPSNSTRRYEYIEYESGRTLGLKNYCSRGSTKVDSWWRYIFWHCSYCFCICDEQGIKSDRYFNLRETVSNIDDNKVVTGLRFVKHKRVFHIQIQEGQLLPRGNVNQSTLSWKPVEDYQIFDRGVSNGYDYHTLGWDKRAIDLDDIEGDDVSHVVTGIRFRVVGAHLNLEARLSEYNFENGKLVNPKTSSFWKSNDNTDVSGERREQISLKDPDVPTRTLVQSLPTSRHNQYVEFTHTSMDRDAAQTTVPFIDIQEVTSNPPVPLAGVGLYHKGRNNYGGFIAPKLITYDFTPYVRLPNNDTK
ncbi:uncharacterized protein LOC129912439 isoform X2 [Episyrphus balteatus]|uniref:uncharacterized protein LOC129912439 isoform X2 n=1 Tax=Episyrphus balteatus TaxID=286459 RepID=UPI0024862998|nr:uncharacterized protein LOC129912439 isoform X2 [Episyrphus balteatus]